MSKDLILIQDDDMRVTIYTQPRYPDNPEAVQVETLVNIVRGAEDMTMPIKDLGRLIEITKAAHKLVVLRSVY